MNIIHPCENAQACKRANGLSFASIVINKRYFMFIRHMLLTQPSISNSNVVHSIYFYFGIGQSIGK